MGNYIGEIASFGTVICWIVCSMAFEKAGKKIGSMTVNLIRLIFALVFICIITYITRGFILPTDATSKTWFWLSLSGVVGFFIGDLCLFRAFVTIGSRISMLIYSLVPPISAVLGLVVFNEKMSAIAIVGMIVTLVGIGFAILKKTDNKISFSHPVKGVTLAVIGAICQALGVGLSKFGMTLTDGSIYDPWACTQIRIISATICFILLFIFTKRWSYIKKAIVMPRPMVEVAVGSVFGPVIGVTLGLIAITYISMGVSSTIIAVLPVAIIIPHVIFYKEKIHLREIIGAVITVIGVSLLFI
ncbi:MAG: DMT family transporter [Spirochaetaceae bacterium]